MKKYLFIIPFITIFLTTKSSFSQVWKRNRAELVFGAGATNFLGELGGANHIGTHGFKDFNTTAIRYAFNFGYLYKLDKHQQVETDFYYARLGGNDNYTQEMFRNNRDISFRTPVIELAAKYIYCIGREKRGHIYNLKGVRGLNNIQVFTYFFIGAGVFYFNPKGQYRSVPGYEIPGAKDGKWYALHPMSTEGEGIYPSRKKYHLVQPTIPLGMGFRYLIAPQWLIGIEYTIHKTFTDYIDDCSTTYANPILIAERKGALAAWFSNPPNNNPSIPYATAPNQERGDPRYKDSFMYLLISLRYRIPYAKHFLGIPKF